MTTLPTLSPLAWLNLDTPTRIKIAALFGIPQSKPSHVVGGEVVDSGHSWADLAVITVESLQAKLGIDEDDFTKLWIALVERCKSPHPTVPDQSPDLGGYVCGICTKSFKSKAGLGGHKRTHGKN